MCDFFNPYLDFNEFALKIGYGLPAISIIGHWDGQPLRYVFHPFFLITFFLYYVLPHAYPLGFLLQKDSGMVDLLFSFFESRMCC